MSGGVIKNHAGFIWSVADLLRGVYKQSEYGRVILPLTVLRRLDCVLEPTKGEVLETMADLPTTLRNREPLLQQVAGQPFVNTSRHTFATLLGDPDNVAGNLRNYIAGFSESARDIVGKFNFDVQIDRPGRPQPALSRGVEVRRGRPEPRRGVEPGDGVPVRGADPSVLGAVERDGGRALHTSRGDPADGEPAVRRRRRAADPPRRGEDPARPRVRHGRDAVGGRGLPA